MSATRTTTRTGSRRGDPGGPGGPGGAAAAVAQPDGPNDEPVYVNKPNVRPKTVEAVPSVEWARWRLYKQRDDLKDRFPDYFPDVRKQLYDSLQAEDRADKEMIPDPPRFKKRSLDELKGNYKPQQLGFRVLTDFYDEVDQQNARLSRRQRLDSDEEGDRIPSLWFERMAQDLFARVWEFCSETFGLHSLGESYGARDWTLRWLDKLPKEFVVLASQVARGDRTIVEPKGSDPNNWEFLFLHKDSRVKLMVGVMAKLLEKNVFNSLLFGAADVEKTALVADDEARAFLDNSYQRNRTRAETVRNYIQANRPPLGTGLGDLFTDNFWIEVDSVTMGILDLLLPLINLLGQDMPDTLWPSLTQVHQRLHDIVAEAAWFTNGMRATKSVFWIQFPLPGELNDISHEHATDDIWKASKLAAEKHDVAARNEWEAEMDRELMRKYPGEAITQAHRADYEAGKRRPYVRRTAKVQVAMWPFIKRFTPMRERDAGDGAYNAGETITQIMKAQCVYYNGDDSDEADMYERLTLSEQIKNRRWAKWFTLRAFLLYALIFLLFLFITSPEVQQGLRDHPWGIGSSSQDQGSMKEGRTTTTVPGPVGNETATVTERETSTVTTHETVTSTKTETVTREPDRREDDDNTKEDDDNNKEKDDDDNVGDGVDVDTSGNASTGEATAENTASLKDGAAESLSSAKDRISSEMSSKTEEIKSSLSSEMARLSSIESSVREGAKGRITDANSRQSLADESSSSRAHKSSAAKSRAAEQSSKSKAGRSSSSAANSASRSSAEESRKDRSAARSSSSAANADKSRSDKESRSSSRSSSSAAIISQRSSASSSKESRRSSESRAAAESRAQAEAESSAAAERAAASEHSVLADAAASRLALEEEAEQRIRSVLAEKEKEDRRMSSSFYAQQEKESGTITTLTSEEGGSASSSTSKKPDQGPEITTQGDGIDTTIERTTTVTVEPGVVVVAVTRTTSQAETKGPVGTVVDKANTVAEYWRDISSAFQNFTVWGAVRFLLFRVILLHPLMSLLLLILIAVTVRHLIERGWLRNQGQWVGGGQG